MADTIAILQADMLLTRVPGLVLEPIAGEPMLARCIERIERAFKIDRLVVATSFDRSDDPFVALCERFNVDCYRGSLHDLLDRFYQAACPHRPQQIVRLNANCPLIDPVLIDDVIARFEKSHCDYCSNTIQQTYPQGLEIEVFSSSSLQTAWKEAQVPADREQVTSFLWRQPIRFRNSQVTDLLDRSHMRWVVQESADLEFVRRVYDHLYPYGPAFCREDVIELLEECPELAAINAGHHASYAYLPQRAAA